MATIGMDKLYYAKITEDDGGEETYSPPVRLAKAIKADLSVELVEAILYADDGAAYVIKDFKSGKLSLGVDDIGVTAATDLTGGVVDDNGVLISLSENEGTPVAVGFRAQKPDGRYRYFWLYRVKFGVPSTNLQTKGDTITFQTPTIEGTIMRRNRADAVGKHPWKAEVTEGDAGVSSTTITEWYTSVYEPVYSEAEPTTETITVALNPQGGTVTPSNIDVTIGEVYGTLPTPVLAGSTFDGWFTAAVDGTEVTATTVVDDTVTTLYAHWTTTP